MRRRGKKGIKRKGKIREKSKRMRKKKKEEKRKRTEVIFMAPQVERHQTETDPGCHSQLSVGISHGAGRLRGKYLLEMNFTEERNPATGESDLLILSPDAPSEGRSTTLGFCFFSFISFFSPSVHLRNICARQRFFTEHSQQFVRDMNE